MTGLARGSVPSLLFPTMATPHGPTLLTASWPAGQPLPNSEELARLSAHAAGDRKDSASRRRNRTGALRPRKPRQLAVSTPGEHRGSCPMTHSKQAEKNPQAVRASVSAESLSDTFRYPDGPLTTLQLDGGSSRSLSASIEGAEKDERKLSVSHGSRAMSTHRSVTGGARGARHPLNSPLGGRRGDNQKSVDQSPFSEDEQMEPVHDGSTISQGNGRERIPVSSFAYHSAPVSSRRGGGASLGAPGVSVQPGLSTSPADSLSLSGCSTLPPTPVTPSVVELPVFQRLLAQSEEEQRVRQQEKKHNVSQKPQGHHLYVHRKRTEDNRLFSGVNSGKFAESQSTKTDNLPTLSSSTSPSSLGEIIRSAARKIPLSSPVYLTDVESLVDGETEYERSSQEQSHSGNCSFEERTSVSVGNRQVEYEFTHFGHPPFQSFSQRSTAGSVLASRSSFPQTSFLDCDSKRTDANSFVSPSSLHKEEKKGKGKFLQALSDTLVVEDRSQEDKTHVGESHGRRGLSSSKSRTPSAKREGGKRERFVLHSRNFSDNGRSPRPEELGDLRGTVETMENAFLSSCLPLKKTALSEKGEKKFFPVPSEDVISLLSSSARFLQEYKKNEDMTVSYVSTQSFPEIRTGASVSWKTQVDVHPKPQVVNDWVAGEEARLLETLELEKQKNSSSLVSSPPPASALGSSSSSSPYLGLASRSERDLWRSELGQADSNAQSAFLSVLPSEGVSKSQPNAVPPTTLETSSRAIQGIRERDRATSVAGEEVSGFRRDTGLFYHLQDFKLSSPNTSQLYTKLQCSSRENTPLVDAYVDPLFGGGIYTKELGTSLLSGGRAESTPDLSQVPQQPNNTTLIAPPTSTQVEGPVPMFGRWDGRSEGNHQDGECLGERASRRNAQEGPRIHESSLLPGVVDGVEIFSMDKPLSISALDSSKGGGMSSLTQSNGRRSPVGKGIVLKPRDDISSSKVFSSLAISSPFQVSALSSSSSLRVGLQGNTKRSHGNTGLFHVGDGQVTSSYPRDPSAAMSPSPQPAREKTTTVSLPLSSTTSCQSLPDSHLDLWSSIQVPADLKMSLTSLDEKSEGRTTTKSMLHALPPSSSSASLRSEKGMTAATACLAESSSPKDASGAQPNYESKVTMSSDAVKNSFPPLFSSSSSRSSSPSLLALSSGRKDKWTAAAALTSSSSTADSHLDLWSSILLPVGEANPSVASTSSSIPSTSPHQRVSASSSPPSCMKSLSSHHTTDSSSRGGYGGLPKETETEAPRERPISDGSSQTFPHPEKSPQIFPLGFFSLLKEIEWRRTMISSSSLSPATAAARRATSCFEKEHAGDDVGLRGRASQTSRENQIPSSPSSRFPPNSISTVSKLGVSSSVAHNVSGRLCSSSPMLYADTQKELPSSSAAGTRERCVSFRGEVPMKSGGTMEMKDAEGDKGKTMELNEISSSFSSPPSQQSVNREVRKNGQEETTIDMSEMDRVTTPSHQSAEVKEYFERKQDKSSPLLVLMHENSLPVHKADNTSEMGRNLKDMQRQAPTSLKAFLELEEIREGQREMQRRQAHREQQQEWQAEQLREISRQQEYLQMLMQKLRLEHEMMMVSRPTHQVMYAKDGNEEREGEKARGKERFLKMDENSQRCRADIQTSPQDAFTPVVHQTLAETEALNAPFLHDDDDDIQPPQGLGVSYEELHKEKQRRAAEDCSSDNRQAEVLLGSQKMVDEKQKTSTQLEAPQDHRVSPSLQCECKKEETAGESNQHVQLAPQEQERHKSEIREGEETGERREGSEAETEVSSGGDMRETEERLHRGRQKENLEGKDRGDEVQYHVIEVPERVTFTERQASTRHKIDDVVRDNGRDYTEREENQKDVVLFQPNRADPTMMELPEQENEGKQEGHASGIMANRREDASEFNSGEKRHEGNDVSSWKGEKEEKSIHGERSEQWSSDREKKYGEDKDGHKTETLLDDEGKKNSDHLTLRGEKDQSSGPELLCGGPSPLLTSTSPTDRNQENGSNMWGALPHDVDVIEEKILKPSQYVERKEDRGGVAGGLSSGMYQKEAVLRSRHNLLEECERVMIKEKGQREQRLTQEERNCFASSFSPPSSRKTEREVLLRYPSPMKGKETVEDVHHPEFPCRDVHGENRDIWSLTGASLVEQKEGEQLKEEKDRKGVNDDGEPKVESERRKHQAGFPKGEIQVMKDVTSSSASSFSSSALQSPSFIPSERPISLLSASSSRLLLLSHEPQPSSPPHAAAAGGCEDSHVVKDIFFSEHGRQKGRSLPIISRVCGEGSRHKSTIESSVENLLHGTSSLRPSTSNTDLRQASDVKLLSKAQRVPDREEKEAFMPRERGERDRMMLGDKRKEEVVVAEGGLLGEAQDSKDNERKGRKNQMKDKRSIRDCLSEQNSERYIGGVVGNKPIQVERTLPSSSVEEIKRTSFFASSREGDDFHRRERYDVSSLSPSVGRPPENAWASSASSSSPCVRPSSQSRAVQTSVFSFPLFSSAEGDDHHKEPPLVEVSSAQGGVDVSRVTPARGSFRKPSSREPNLLSPEGVCPPVPCLSSNGVCEKKENCRRIISTVSDVSIPPSRPRYVISSSFARDPLVLLHSSQVLSNSSSSSFTQTCSLNSSSSSSLCTNMNPFLVSSQQRSYSLPSSRSLQSRLVAKAALESSSSSCSPLTRRDPNTIQAKEGTLLSASLSCHEEASASLTSSLAQVSVSQELQSVLRPLLLLVSSAKHTQRQTDMKKREKSRMFTSCRSTCPSNSKKEDVRSRVVDLQMDGHRRSTSISSKKAPVVESPVKKEKEEGRKSPISSCSPRLPVEKEKVKLDAPTAPPDLVEIFPHNSFKRKTHNTSEDSTSISSSCSGSHVTNQDKSRGGDVVRGSGERLEERSHDQAATSNRSYPSVHAKRFKDVGEQSFSHSSSKEVDSKERGRGRHRHRFDDDIPSSLSSSECVNSYSSASSLSDEFGKESSDCLMTGGEGLYGDGGGVVHRRKERTDISQIAYEGEGSLELPLTLSALQEGGEDTSSQTSPLLPSVVGASKNPELMIRYGRRKTIETRQVEGKSDDSFSFPYYQFISFGHSFASKEQQEEIAKDKGKQRGKDRREEGVELRGRRRTEEEDVLFQQGEECLPSSFFQSSSLHLFPQMPSEDHHSLEEDRLLQVSSSLSLLLSSFTEEEAHPLQESVIQSLASWVREGCQQVSFKVPEKDLTNERRKELMSGLHARSHALLSSSSLSGSQQEEGIPEIGKSSQERERKDKEKEEIGERGPRRKERSEEEEVKESFKKESLMEGEKRDENSFSGEDCILKLSSALERGRGGMTEERTRDAVQEVYDVLQERLLQEMKRMIEKRDRTREDEYDSRGHDPSRQLNGRSSSASTSPAESVFLTDGMDHTSDERRANMKEKVLSRRVRTTSTSLRSSSLQSFNSEGNQGKSRTPPRSASLSLIVQALLFLLLQGNLERSRDGEGVSNEKERTDGENKRRDREMDTKKKTKEEDRPFTCGSSAFVYQENLQETEERQGNVERQEETFISQRKKDRGEGLSDEKLKGLLRGTSQSTGDVENRTQIIRAETREEKNGENTEPHEPSSFKFSSFSTQRRRVQEGNRVKMTREKRNLGEKKAVEEDEEKTKRKAKESKREDHKRREDQPRLASTHMKIEKKGGEGQSYEERCKKETRRMTSDLRVPRVYEASSVEYEEEMLRTKGIGRKHGSVLTGEKRTVTRKAETNKLLQKDAFLQSRERFEKGNTIAGREVETSKTEETKTDRRKSRRSNTGDAEGEERPPYHSRGGGNDYGKTLLRKEYRERDEMNVVGDETSKREEELLQRVLNVPRSPFVGKSTSNSYNPCSLERDFRGSLTQSSSKAKEKKKEADLFPDDVYFPSYSVSTKPAEGSLEAHQTRHGKSHEAARELSRHVFFPPSSSSYPSSWGDQDESVASRSKKTVDKPSRELQHQLKKKREGQERLLEPVSSTKPFPPHRKRFCSSSKETRAIRPTSAKGMVSTTSSYKRTVSALPPPSDDLHTQPRRRDREPRRTLRELLPVGEDHRTNNVVFSVDMSDERSENNSLETGRREKDMYDVEQSGEITTQEETHKSPCRRHEKKTAGGKSSRDNNRHLRFSSCDSDEGRVDHLERRKKESRFGEQGGSSFDRLDIIDVQQLRKTRDEKKNIGDCFLPKKTDPEEKIEEEDSWLWSRHTLTPAENGDRQGRKQGAKSRGKQNAAAIVDTNSEARDDGGLEFSRKPDDEHPQVGGREEKVKDSYRRDAKPCDRGSTGEKGERRKRHEETDSSGSHRNAGVTRDREFKTEDLLSEQQGEKNLVFEIKEMKGMRRQRDAESSYMKMKVEKESRRKEGLSTRREGDNKNSLSTSRLMNEERKEEERLLRALLAKVRPDVSFEVFMRSGLEGGENASSTGEKESEDQNRQRVFACQRIEEKETGSQGAVKGRVRRKRDGETETQSRRKERSGFRHVKEENVSLRRKNDREKLAESEDKLLPYTVFHEAGSEDTRRHAETSSVILGGSSRNNLNSDTCHTSFFLDNSPAREVFTATQQTHQRPPSLRQHDKTCAWTVSSVSVLHEGNSSVRSSQTSPLLLPRGSRVVRGKTGEGSRRDLEDRHVSLPYHFHHADIAGRSASEADLHRDKATTALEPSTFGYMRHDKLKVIAVSKKNDEEVHSVQAEDGLISFFRKANSTSLTPQRRNLEGTFLPKSPQVQKTIPPTVRAGRIDGGSLDEGEGEDRGREKKEGKESESVWGWSGEVVIGQEEKDNDKGSNNASLYFTPLSSLGFSHPVSGGALAREDNSTEERLYSSGVLSSHRENMIREEKEKKKGWFSPDLLVKSSRVTPVSHREQVAFPSPHRVPSGVHTPDRYSTSVPPDIRSSSSRWNQGEQNIRSKLLKAKASSKGYRGVSQPTQVPSSPSFHLRGVSQATTPKQQHTISCGDTEKRKKVSTAQMAEKLVSEDGGMTAEEVHRCLAYLRRLERVSRDTLRHLSTDSPGSSTDGEGHSAVSEDGVESYPYLVTKEDRKKARSKRKESTRRNTRRDKGGNPPSERGYLRLHTSLLLDSESE